MVEWEEVEEAQRVIHGHLRAYNLIFGTGEDQGEKGQARVWKAKELKATTIPVLSQRLKDHKVVAPGEEVPTRPVCGASSSVNGECSEWLADIVDSANDARNTRELVSCEELCGLIDDLNEDFKARSQDMNEVMISSLDAKALYPSLNIRKSAKIVAERVTESGVKIEGVNYKWVGKYLALTMSRNEVVNTGLSRVVPKKTGGQQGRDRSIKSIEIDQKKERWHWKVMPDKYTDADKKRMMKEVINQMVKATFNNHFYTWDGKLYKQMKGGGTGLRGTGSVARCVMDDWCEKWCVR